MPMGGAIAAGGSVVSAGLGYLSAEKDRAAQRRYIKNAMKELKKAGYPPDLSKEIIFQQFEQAGILTPQLEEDIAVAESEMGQLKEDPSLKSAQLKALAQMQQRAKVGLSAEDRAALNQVRSEVQRDAEAKRQQILQQMQSRGMGGSGAELMAQLQASQGAADQASAASDTLMAQAQQRALQALGQSAGMASDIRGQDFSVNQARAQALDERNRFLAQNSIARQRQNVGIMNDAQRMNLAEQQRIQDMNAQMANAEKLRQSSEKGAYFDRKLGLAQAKAAAQMGQAAAAGQQAQNTQQMFSNLGAGLGKLGAAAYQGGMFGGGNTATPDAAGGTTGYSEDYLKGNTGGY